MDELTRLSLALIEKCINIQGLSSLIGNYYSAIINAVVEKKVKAELSDLNDEGIKALKALMDGNSDFQKHASGENIARRFYVDPLKVDTVYHYTDISVLKKLIYSRQFYMGSAYHMNDPLEIKYTYDISQKILDEMGASQDEKMAFNQDTKSTIFDSYIWSFSANKNNQALNNYGEIAIGIDVQKLQNHLANRNTNLYFENMHEGNGYTFPLYVEYNEEIQNEYLRSVLKEWLLAYRGLKNTPLEKVASDIAFECIQALFLFSLCFKRHLLYQEEEIRFVVERISISKEQKPDTHFNNRPVIITDFTPDMVSSIVVSHKNGADKRIKEIKQYLIEHGFEQTKVLLTDMPY